MRFCLLPVVLMCLLPGCGGESVSSYHPTGSTAREALVFALETWKGGREKAGTIEGRTPAVLAQDSVWDSGKRLESYQIGTEHPGTDGPTKFSVELRYANEAAPSPAEYFVFGKDPLWVVRDQDYLKMSGMGGQKKGG